MTTFAPTIGAPDSSATTPESVAPASCAFTWKENDRAMDKQAHAAKMRPNHVLCVRMLTVPSS